jgi:hypothetical protein
MSDNRAITPKRRAYEVGDGKTFIAPDGQGYAPTLADILQDTIDAVKQIQRIMEREQQQAAATHDLRTKTDPRRGKRGKWIPPRRV